MENQTNATVNNTTQDIKDTATAMKECIQETSLYTRHKKKIIGTGVAAAAIAGMYLFGTRTAMGQVLATKALEAGAQALGKIGSVFTTGQTVTLEGGDMVTHDPVEPTVVDPDASLNAGAEQDMALEIATDTGAELGASSDEAQVSMELAANLK